jgi:hypothetical protein
LEAFTNDNENIPIKTLYPILLPETLEHLIEKYHKDTYGEINKNPNFFVGDIIRCKHSTNKFDRIKIVLESKQTKRTLYLNSDDIDTCKITKVNEHSVRADILNCCIKSGKGISDALIKLICNKIKTQKVNVNLRKRQIEHFNLTIKFINS